MPERIPSVQALGEIVQLAERYAEAVNECFEYDRGLKERPPNSRPDRARHALEKDLLERLQCPEALSPSGWPAAIRACLDRLRDSPDGVGCYHASSFIKAIDGRRTFDHQRARERI